MIQIRLKSVRQLSLLAGMTLGTAAVAPVASAQLAQPNIILLVADDLGYYEVLNQNPASLPSPRTWQGADPNFTAANQVTPNIARISQRGLRFTNAYATAPQCSPARLSILTGKTPQRIHSPGGNNGIAPTGDGCSWEVNNAAGIGPNNFVASNDADANRRRAAPVWLMTRLKNQGYVTCGIGKWHNGPGVFNRFDEFFGFEGANRRYDDGTAQTTNDPDRASNYGYWRDQQTNPAFNGRLEVKGFGFPIGSALTVYPVSEIPASATAEDPLSITDLFADKAVEFIQARQSSNTPFFLCVQFTANHAPVFDPAVADNATDQEKLRAATRRLDTAVGTIIESLTSAELANTIIIFTSDHGSGREFGYADTNQNNGGDDITNRLLTTGYQSTGADSIVSRNHPFRGGKLDLYEGAIRVPLLVQWPAGNLRVSVNSSLVDLEQDFNNMPGAIQNFSAPVSHLDIVPTLLAAAGLNPTNIENNEDRIGNSDGVTFDGTNLLPYLQDRVAPAGTLDAATPVVRRYLNDSTATTTALFWRFGADKYAVRQANNKVLREAYFTTVWNNYNPAAVLYNLNDRMVEVSVAGNSGPQTGLQNLYNSWVNQFNAAPYAVPPRTPSN
jgi:arylsulfatase B